MVAFWLALDTICCWYVWSTTNRWREIHFGSNVTQQSINQFGLLIQINAIQIANTCEKCELKSTCHEFPSFCSRFQSVMHKSTLSSVMNLFVLIVNNSGTIKFRAICWNEADEQRKKLNIQFLWMNEDKRKNVLESNLTPY